MSHLEKMSNTSQPKMHIRNRTCGRERNGMEQQHGTEWNQKLDELMGIVQVLLGV